MAKVSSVLGVFPGEQIFLVVDWGAGCLVRSPSTSTADDVTPKKYKGRVEVLDATTDRTNGEEEKVEEVDCQRLGSSNSATKVLTFKVSPAKHLTSHPAQYALPTPTTPPPSTPQLRSPNRNPQLRTRRPLLPDRRLLLILHPLSRPDFPSPTNPPSLTPTTISNVPASSPWRLP